MHFKTGLGIGLLVLALAGCGAPTATNEAASGATNGATAEATANAEVKPITFVFQKQKDPAEVEASANKVAEVLSGSLGAKVSVVVPTQYSATIQALISNRAQAAYVSGLAYVLAQKEVPLEILAVEERQGRMDYDSILVVRKGVTVGSWADLKGKRVAFTSPTSTSGYLMPYGDMIDEGLIPKAGDPKTYFGEVLFAGGYEQALRAVLNGQVDAAFVSDYTMEGDTADVYLPKVDRDKLSVAKRFPGVPTHLIAVRKDVPEETKVALRKGLETLSTDQPQLLSDVYGASKFRFDVSDAHVKSVNDALVRTGLDAAKMIQ